MDTNTEKYTISMRIFHWLMFILVASTLALGAIMVDLDDKVVSYKYSLYGIHKSLGVMILGLVLIRLIFRFTSKIPAYPSSFNKYEVLLSKLTHWVFYGIMLFLPIDGYLLSNYAGYPVSFFGFQLPTIVGKNEKMADLLGEIHEVLPYIFLALIILHVLAAIKHYFFDKINIFKRMI